jgi:hypothetical protein
VVVETDESATRQKNFIGAKVKNWTNAKIRPGGGGARAKEEVQAASTYQYLFVGFPLSLSVGFSCTSRRVTSPFTQPLVLGI